MGRLNQRSPKHFQLTQVKYIPLLIIVAVAILLPFVVPLYLRSMLTEVLIFAIFALSLNLIFGYTGLMSLGHAAFFGVGSYFVSVPILRFGINNFWLIMLLAIVANGALSAVFGVIALRVSGIYFLLVTLALGQLVYYTSFAWTSMTGGTSGIFGLQYPDLGFRFPWNDTYFYFLSLIILAISASIMYIIIQSPFGQSLRGIRENKRRMRALGYNVWLHSYIAFIIAGIFAGVAGVLYGYYLKGTTPTQLSLATSAMALLIVILGSSRIFWGPILGSVLVILIQYFITINIPQRWPMILGAIFVLSVMFLRGGVGIYINRLLDMIKQHFVVPDK